MHSNTASSSAPAAAPTPARSTNWPFGRLTPQQIRERARMEAALQVRALARMQEALL